MIMLVDVYVYYADLCGNISEYFYGTYRCVSLSQAERIFPEKGLVGWHVYENKQKPLTLPHQTPTIPSRPDLERGRVVPAQGTPWTNSTNATEAQSDPDLKTWDEWKALDLHVVKGEKSCGRNAQGVPVFHRSQVTRRVRTAYYNGGFVDTRRPTSEDYSEDEESDTVYYADGSGYRKGSGPCGPLYFDKFGNT